MIRIENLNKRYGKVHAVKDLSLEIGQGTLFGFVGPNGAGKSTTMLILATLLAPSSGQALIGGYDVVRHPKQAKKLIGYMPDFFGVYDNLKATEYLDFYAASYGIAKPERAKIIPQLLELVNLSDKSDAYVDALSRGMKQRLGLARCLVHDPPALILDEPASGLDPRARVEFREILKELRAMGKTIIISSHILPELAEMCDDIGIIEKGELVARGSVAAIHAQMQGQRTVHVRLLEKEEAGYAILQDHPAVASVSRGNGHLVVAVKGEEGEQARILRDLIAADLPVVHFAEAGNNLEDIFMEITKGVSA